LPVFFTIRRIPRCFFSVLHRGGTDETANSFPLPQREETETGMKNIISLFKSYFLHRKEEAQEQALPFSFSKRDNQKDTHPTDFCCSKESSTLQDYKHFPYKTFPSQDMLDFSKKAPMFNLTIRSVHSN